MAFVPAPSQPWRAWARHAPAAIGLLAAAAALAVGAFLVVRDGGNRVGSGVLATDVRELPPFTGVELAATNDVTIRVGSPQRVVVRGEANLLPLVTTKVKSDKLVIDASRGFRTTRPMRVVVTVPGLTTVTLAGAGVIAAEGAVQHLVATMAGVGQLKLAPLTARDVVAVLAGAGRVDVTATHSLDAVLAGSGAIVYGGNPAHVSKRISGTGTVTPR